MRGRAGLSAAKRDEGWVRGVDFMNSLRREPMMSGWATSGIKASSPRAPTASCALS